VSPTINRQLGLAHLGSTKLSGRGLVSLAGKGQIHEVVLDEFDKYIVHPSNVLAYTVTKATPELYRLKYSTFKFQIPGFQWSKLLPDIKFFQVMSQSDTWKTLTKYWFKLRLWARRSVWGDRVRFSQHEVIPMLTNLSNSSISKDPPPYYYSRVRLLLEIFS
jgi:hypothetical protein